MRDQLDEEEPEANRIVFSYHLVREKARAFLAQERLSYNARDLADDVLTTPLIREVGTDSFAFTHLTLQEYLAARAFADFYKSNEFAGLEIFCRAYHNPTIVEMEILPMILGTMTNADKLYAEIECWPESLTFTSLRLRARGLAYSAKIKQDRLSKMIDRLIEFISRKNPDETPFREMVTNSFVGMNRQTVSLIENKAISLIKTDGPDFISTDVSPDYQNPVEALITIGSDKAVDALVSALNSSNNKVRWRAVNALGEVGSEKADDAIVSALNDKDYSVRWIAARALGRFSSEKAVDALISGLNHEDSGVRMFAAETLGRVGSEKTVDALICALNHSDHFVRGKASEALGLIGSNKAIDGLIPLLNDEDQNVRLKTVRALGRLGSDKAVNALLSTLDDKEGLVRLEVAEALRQLGSKKAADVAFLALKDEDWYVRVNAAEALGRIGSEKAIDALTFALNDEDSSVRSNAAEALGNIGSNKVIPALLTTLNDDDDSEVRAKAAEALGNVGIQETVDDLIAALAGEDDYVRVCAAEALGNMGSEKAVDALINALSDKDRYLRGSAAEALGRIGSEKAVAVLTLALNDQSSSVRSSASEALARLEVETLISGLGRTVEHHDIFARKKAAEVLGYYSHDRKTLEQLLHLARTDEENGVRVAANEAAKKFALKLEFFGYTVSESTSRSLSGNESRELFLVGEAFRVTAEAGHIFRPTPNSDWGIDGEIEFKNEHGEASGDRVYLQLKSGDSYLRKRKRDGKEIFSIKKRHAEYWQSHAYPVLLVIRESRGRTRWMNVTEYLQRHGATVRQIEFQGEPFTVEIVKTMPIRFAR